MEAYLHQEFLGTSHHLKIHKEESRFQWVSSIPEGSWVLSRNGRTANEIRSIMRLTGTKIPDIAPENQLRSMQVVGIGDRGVVPWNLVLPKEQFLDRLQDVSDGIWMTLDAFDEDPYGVTYLKSCRMLQALGRASINHNLLKSYIKEESTPTILKILGTFAPHEDGFAAACTYDQLSTSTGRLVVKEGPQVLTLPKRHRDIITSQYDNGVVCQIDFVSLEPRVLRIISGNEPPDDVYNDIASNVFTGAVERDHVKLAVLCALYGVSKRRLQNMLGPSRNAARVISQIKEYFGLMELSRNLRMQLKNYGYLKNWFGKVLQAEDHSEHILISHFTQSTAVDVAMCGFLQLVGRAKSEGIEFSPLFLIHDALLVDIPTDHLQAFLQLANEGVSIESLGTFPLGVDIISGQT